MLKVPEMEHLIEQNIASKIDFDQCAYGLRPLQAPGTEDNNDRVKKPTSILTNMPKAFEYLHRTCDGTHRHEHAIGAVRLEGRWQKRAHAAGTYPPALCRQLVRLVLSNLRSS